MTTDALGAYRRLIPMAFLDNVDLAQQRKEYIRDSDPRPTSAVYKVVETVIVNGDLDPDHRFPPFVTHHVARLKSVLTHKYLPLTA